MSELSTGKSILVCAVVLGCFAVLWPKIFYPMFFDHSFKSKQMHARAGDRPIYMNPELARKSVPSFDEAATLKRTVDKELKPGMPIPGMRPSMGGPGIIQPPQPQQKQGAMGMLMPLYTVGIVIFFVYTTMKLLFKNDSCSGTTSSFSPPAASALSTHKLLTNAKIIDASDVAARLSRDQHQAPRRQCVKETTVESASDNEMDGEVAEEEEVTPVVTTSCHDVKLPEVIPKPEEAKSSETSDVLNLLHETLVDGLEDPRDVEIALLKRRLFATEKAIVKLLRQMESIATNSETNSSTVTTGEWLKEIEISEDITHDSFN